VRVPFLSSIVSCRRNSTSGPVPIKFCGKDSLKNNRVLLKSWNLFFVTAPYFFVILHLYIDYQRYFHVSVPSTVIIIVMEWWNIKESEAVWWKIVKFDIESQVNHAFFREIKLENQTFLLKVAFANFIEIVDLKHY